MMKIDLDEVRKSGLTLEQVLALLTLELTRIGQSIPYTSVDDKDVVELFDRGLLNADGNGYSVTKDGQTVIGTVLGHAKKKADTPEKIKVEKKDFEEFWKQFPANDLNGNWIRTRTLKSDKTRCTELYKRAVQGGVTPAQILKALAWEVADRKAKSTTSNRMSYMKASAAWLYQKEYEIILEELDNGDVQDDPSDSWLTTLV